jgi:nucleoside-diphosphate-sugar epimerase
MRVYVTGADGMLGTALVAALREDPATVGWPLLGVSLDDFDIGDGPTRSSTPPLTPSSTTARPIRSWPYG